MFQGHGGVEGQVRDLFEGLEVKRSKPAKIRNLPFLEPTIFRILHSRPVSTNQKQKVVIQSIFYFLPFLDPKKVAIT